jgi:polar amino acid transport system substrate-binding protein
MCRETLSTIRVGQGAKTMTVKSRAVAQRLFVIVAAALATLAPSQAPAQTCGKDYVLTQGDTLADIARVVYGSASQWSLIYYANQDRLGDNTTLLVPGLAIKIPCIGAQQPKPAAPTAPIEAALPPPSSTDSGPFQLSSMLRRIDFLTADGYSPFTGRNLPEGGLLIDLLQSSMNLIKEQAKGSFDFQISWVNDWAAHLNPLLITRALDAGIPWTKPDCSNPAALDRSSQYRCQKFFFSDPFYESVTELFTRNNSDFNFDKDEQIAGRTLCLTKGWSTYDLDKNGRNWLKNGTITLMQPQTIEECFRLLDEGTVDAVVVAELTGQAVAAAMGMADRVHASKRPVNIETMHVIIAKTHPHARTVLYYVNSSLAKLKETGTYDAIVAKHLEQFWNSFGQTPSTGSFPAPAPPASTSKNPAPASQTKPEPSKSNADGRKTAQP